MKIGKRLSCLFVALIMCFGVSFAVSAAPPAKADSTTSETSAAKTRDWRPVNALKANNISKLVNANNSSVTANTTTPRSTDAVSPQFFSTPDVSMYELVEYECSYIDGEWYYDDQNPQYTDFISGVQGYQVTSPFQYTLAYVIVAESGNFWGRSAYFLDDYTSPATNDPVAYNDMDIQSVYNGNKIIGRYVGFYIPTIVTPQGGGLIYTGEVTSTQSIINTLGFAAQTTTP